MRLLHTSDWHLGHVLHEHDRGPEHDAFLSWLLGALDEREVDALIVAGDVFETSNPPAAAQRRWYRFLAEARRRCSKLDIVVVGGNHDSAARLDAPRDLLEELGVHVVGGLPRRSDGRIDTDRVVLPLHGPDGEVAAWVAAVPYLRVSDLPRVDSARDPLIEGVRQVYAEVLEAARAVRRPGQALIATGHCYMTGTKLSEMSERRILGGNQHALPTDVFPEDVAYVALGHLHLAQPVGARHIRYSGSPIPLSFGERGYQHQVLLVEVEGERMESVERLVIPRSVDLLRLPENEPAPLEDVLRQLASLPAATGPRESWPFLEVRVRLERPEPTLRQAVEEALRDKGVRLAAILTSMSGTGDALGDVEPVLDLRELEIETVFLRCWEARYADPPDDEVLSIFHTLVETVGSEEA